MNETTLPSISLFDHGYVREVEHWGSDERIIEAARMSTNKGFQGWDTDAKLLAYLYKNKHMTPFEMAGMVVEVQAPIFVFREWHRHRTQSYNELSARYTELPDLFYLPGFDRVQRQSTKNKQGSTEEEPFSTMEKIRVRSAMEGVYRHAREVYEQLIAEGVAREIARLVIPVAQYSRMRASANLRNWLQFLALRMPENAQWEIRQCAEAVAKLIADQFPRTYGLFAEDKE